jgi:hypothetical protein
MNFLGQMRGICLTQLLRKTAGPDDGSMKRRYALQRFRAKRIPVRVKKMRQNKNLELLF